MTSGMKSPGGSTSGTVDQPASENLTRAYLEERVRASRSLAAEATNDDDRAMYLDLATRFEAEQQRAEARERQAASAQQQ